MPSMPKWRGRISSSGTRKSPWREAARKAVSRPRPKAWKKMPEVFWNPSSIRVAAANRRARLPTARNVGSSEKPATSNGAAVRKSREKKMLTPVLSRTAVHSDFRTRSYRQAP